MTCNEMVEGEWYYIECVDTQHASGSGRQTGLFHRFYDDVAVFSKITDIRRPDGTVGHSGLGIDMEGFRHNKWFRFYQPMEESIIQRALLRRYICQKREIDCDAEDFIALL